MMRKTITTYQADKKNTGSVICAKKRNPFHAKMTIRKESGWENMTLDCFRRYFFLKRKSATMQGILQIIFG